MKFYVLKHPEKGYLRSEKSYSSRWTDNLEKARKWNQKNHPLSCRTQRPSLKECKVVEIDVFGFAVLESDKYSVEMDFSKMGKYEL